MSSGISDDNESWQAETDFPVKEVSKLRMRQLSACNSSVLKFLREGFSSQIAGLPANLFQHEAVSSNDFLVNGEFETDQQWFVAHFRDKAEVRVLRVIYVRDDQRGTGIGSAILRDLRRSRFPQRFLQVGVRYTGDSKFDRLERFYSRAGFKRHPNPVCHSFGSYFVDFFWSASPFAVWQEGDRIGVKLLGDTVAM